MTTRERLERKAERRRGWAAKREAGAAAVFQAHERYHGDVAFNTQPGHIPERARVIAREDRAYESLTIARSHTSKADGLDAQLDAAVFDDDPNAIGDLEARIAEREADLAHDKAINAAWRKAKGTPAERFALLVAGGVVAADEAVTLARTLALCPYLKQPCSTTNLATRIRSDKQRIEEIRRNQARAAEAEAAPGGVLIRETNGWCNVTFAEKPDRAILDALKAACFAWAKGTWCGYADKLPECVRAMAT